MSNRQTRRQQSRQARRQATSYRGGRPSGGARGGGGGSGRGPNFLGWPFLTLAGVIAIAAIVVVFVIQPFGSGGDGEASADLAPLDQALADLPLELQDGNRLGRDDAPVTLIQYEDFQCPHCLRYTVEHEAFLVEEFVKAGLLQIEFRHLPVVGSESVTAAIGATCAAEQNRLWEYANRLFAIQTQDGWRGDHGHFEEAALLDLAGELDLDTDAFAACQGDPDSLSTVAAHQAAAQAIGFRGTPSFVLNGIPLQGAPGSNEAWRTLIEETIADVEGEAEGDGETDTEGDEPETDAEGDDSG